MFQWEIIKVPKLLSVTENDLTPVTIDGDILQASSQELAAYEVLESLPSTISFEHAAEIFQGLVNLSPKKVESILVRSNSVQTNRLFLFFGHFYNHPWIKRVNESLVNLGTGKRQIVSNGKLDKRYQITVPEQYIISE